MTNDMPERPSLPPAAMRRIPITIGAVLIGAVIGLAGVYGIGGLKRSAAGDPACRGAVDLAHRLAPLAQGEVAALGMPTSVLVDGEGCEIATIAGPAEWDSDDAIKLITAAVKPAD